MITKEGVITISRGKFFLEGFHLKGINNFDDMRQDLISYIGSILKEENLIPINIVNVSGEYQEPGQENK